MDRFGYGDYEPPPMSVRRTGIVVASQTHFLGSMAPYVVLAQENANLNEQPHELLGIHQDAFKVTAEQVQHDLTQRKNLERRLSRPLLFGDGIEWLSGNATQDRLIYKFVRSGNLYETRCSHGLNQLKLIGVMNPNDRSCLWTSAFGNVTIPEHHRDELIPNVAVNVWISFFFDKANFKIQFGAWDSVCDQSIVRSTPWNQEKLEYRIVYSLPPEDDDSLEGLYEPSQQEQEMPDPLAFTVNLFLRKGIAVSKRTFYCENVNHLIALPLANKPILLGMIYSFEAEWNELNSMYFVTKYSVCSNAISTVADVSELRVPVTAHETFPGVFTSEKYGNLDDPDGVLAMYQLSKYARSTVQVTIKDCRPAAYGDFHFRVAKITDPKKAKKLEEWLSEEKITVCDVKGVVIDNFGTIYSAQYPGIFFRFFDSVDLVPGIKVVFDAQYDSCLKAMVVTRCAMEGGSLRSTRRKVIFTRDGSSQFLFQVVARVPRDFTTMMECEEFGLLSVLTDPLPKFDRAKTYYAWVAMSQPSKGRVVREARTDFFCCSFLEKEPDDKIPGDEMKSTRIDSYLEDIIYNVGKKKSGGKDEESVTANMAKEEADTMNYIEYYYEQMKTLKHDPKCHAESCDTNCPMFLLFYKFAENEGFMTEVLKNDSERTAPFLNALF